MQPMAYLHYFLAHAFPVFFLIAVATRSSADEPTPVAVQMEKIRHAWKEHRAMSRSVSGRVEVASFKDSEGETIPGYTEWFLLTSPQGVMIHRPAALANDPTEKECKVFGLNRDYAFTLRCMVDGGCDTPEDLAQQPWRPAELVRSDPAKPEDTQGIKKLLRSPNLKLTLLHDNLDEFIFGESSVPRVMHEGDKTVWVRVVSSKPSTTTVQSVDLTLDKDNYWVVKKAVVTAPDGDVLTILHNYRLADGFPVITEMHTRSSQVNDSVASFRATLEYPPKEYPDSQFRVSAFGIAEPELVLRGIVPP